MPRIDGPNAVRHLAPKAPDYARDTPLDTLSDDPARGHRIDVKASYTSIGFTWTGGTDIADGSRAGGPYSVFVDGKQVDLGKAQSVTWSDGKRSNPFTEVGVEIPKGRGEALIEIKKDDEVVARLSIDKQGVMKRVALGISDFRNQANIFAGMEDGFLGAMHTEDAAGLAKRAGVHLAKGLLPDQAILGFADGLGIEKSVPKALGLATVGLVGDVVEAAFQGVAALTNGVGAVYKAL